MAEAMMRGLISKGVYAKKDVIACAPSETTRKRISDTLGVTMYSTAAVMIKHTDTVVLAVKPKHIEDVLTKEIPGLGSEKLLISIAAGVGIDTLKSYVPDCRIVRVMPNHCCTVLEGASGYTMGKNTTSSDATLIDRILSALGLAVEVEEKDMDTVTGMSGSSPAFAYMFIRAIADVGVKHGLSEEKALELVAQSMIGAGRMILDSEKTPAELIDNVCSPGGTTIEGVGVLNKREFEKTVSEAIEAVIAKSIKMRNN